MSDNKALSIDELGRMVRYAFHELMKVTYPPPANGECCWSCPYWILDVYSEGYCIVQDDEDGMYYRANFTLAEGSITFDAKEQWALVEKEWMVKSGIDLSRVYIGGQVKALGGGKLAGFLVQYTDTTSPDLTGEFFDAKSDLDIQTGDRLSVYYEHGKDSTLKNRKIGQGTAELQEAGAWFEAQLNLSDKYEEYVYKLAEMGKLGWSTGPAQHLIRKSPAGKAIHIDAWPVKDATLSVSPAEYRNRAIPLKALPHEELKALVTINQSTDDPPVILPDVKSDAAPAVTLTVTTGKSASVVITTPETKEDKPMADNDTQTAPVDETGKRLDGLETAVKSVSDSMTKIMEALSKTPKGEGDFYTNTGGDSDPQVKSLGDFCLALYRSDTKRLKSVYKAQRSDDDVKALAEDQGATGGYRVPTEFSTQLITAQYEISPIINLVRTIPVEAPAGEWPVLDINTAPTAGAGNTALAGQLVSSVIAEAGTFTDRNVKFLLINWRVAKVGDLVKVSSELMEDAGALEALLRQVMTTALAARKERNIMRGNGVGEPIGILNAPALISYNPATSNVFAWADSVGMRARFKMFGGDRARVRWVYHSSVLPDIAAFQVASGSSATWIANMQSDDPTALSLMQYPLMESEHTPQADNDNSVTLCDFGAYGIWQRGQIDIAFSTDYAFNTDEVTWRFKERYDGRPLIQSSVTSADPQGSYTKSAFIGLNATHV